MKVSQKKLDDGKIRLEAVATPQEVNAALNAAHAAFAQSMGVAREQDKSIEKAVEEKLGIKNLDSVVETSAIEALVPFALDKKNIVPAIQPKPEPKTPFKRNREFTFAMTVTTKPNYELKSYDPVTITMAPFSIDESMVDEQIQALARNYTTYETADPKPLESGDNCLLEMRCTRNGEEVPSLTAKSRPYVASEGYMPPSFDEQVLGMQPGETKSFTFEAPSFDDEGNEITETIDATVTLKEIQKPNVPVINDEWVAKYMPMYKTFDAFRNAVRADLEAQGLQQYEQYKRQLAVSALTRRFEGRIPDEFYEAARANIMSDLHANLRQQNMTMDQFLEQNGGEQQVGMMIMMQARESLVQGFSLDAVYRHEHMTLNDADIDAACYTINPNARPKDTRQQLEQTGRGFVLRETAERVKASQWVTGHAIVNYTHNDADTGDEAKEAKEGDTAQQVEKAASKAKSDKAKSDTAKSSTKKKATQSKSTASQAKSTTSKGSTPQAKGAGSKNSTQKAAQSKSTTSKSSTTKSGTTKAKGTAQKGGTTKAKGTAQKSGATGDKD